MIFLSLHKVWKVGKLISTYVQMPHVAIIHRRSLHCVKVEKCSLHWYLQVIYSSSRYVGYDISYKFKFDLVIQEWLKLVKVIINHHSFVFYANINLVSVLRVGIEMQHCLDITLKVTPTDAPHHTCCHYGLWPLNSWWDGWLLCLIYFHLGNEEESMNINYF